MALATVDVLLAEALLVQVAPELSQQQQQQQHDGE
jgi:hypothetical protein